MSKYRSPRDFGNVKMKGKRTMKNPCPCCDTIENKKIVKTVKVLEEEIWDSFKHGTGPLLGDY